LQTSIQAGSFVVIFRIPEGDEKLGQTKILNFYSYFGVTIHQGPGTSQTGRKNSLLGSVDQNLYTSF